MAENDIRVINNGIDLDVFKHTESDFRRKYNLADKKIVLGVASAWGRRKGLFDFAELAGRIKENYQIVLVGLTEEQKESLPKSILGIKRTNSTKELAEIYSAADVFVNPTYADNYPTVNLEAQACGTPVITYKTGGSVESVPASQVVEKGDIDSLLNKIYQICEDGEFEVLNRSRFDKTVLFEEYLDIYMDVINR